MEYLPRYLQTESEIFKKFGITLRESQRYSAVALLFGSSLAETELQDNLMSYRHEFLEDRFVSRPHAYYLIGGEFYSRPIKHYLFNLKSGINPQERDGVTLDGFKKFEGLAAAANKNQVVAWYSPEGDSGLNTVFGAGRIYLSFKVDESLTMNFDIKLHPKFQALSFLDGLSGKQSNGDKFYYLKNPFLLPMSSDQLFPSSFTDESIYVERRHSENASVRSINEAIEEIKREYYASTRVSQILDYSHDKKTTQIMTEQDIMNRYVKLMLPFSQKGKVILYGCSGDSSVSKSELEIILSGKSFIDEVIKQDQIFNNTHSIFSTSSRISKEDSFPCPNCGVNIPVGQGIVKCPSCQITKEKYAEITNSKVCA